MHRWVNRGLLNAPDADQSAAMYEWGCKELEAAGYYLYELSGWAKVSDGDDNYECRHNLQYWRNHSYLGIGAGAHGFAGGFRVANVLHPSEYINRMSESRSSSADIDDLPFPRTPATAEMEEIAKYVEMQETMMLGLRLLREGVSTTNFESRFHRSMQEVFGGIIKRLLEDGLVEWVELDGKILRLSQRGRLLGNHVFMEFV
jgi:oxygen-independent coproporphyrinogen-3 oxidase